MWNAQRPSTGFTSFEKVHTHTQPGCSRQLFNATSKYVTIEPVEIEATIRLDSIFDKECTRRARTLDRIGCWWVVVPNSIQKTFLVVSTEMDLSNVPGNLMDVRTSFQVKSKSNGENLPYGKPGVCHKDLFEATSWSFFSKYQCGSSASIDPEWLFSQSQLSNVAVGHQSWWS